MKRGSTFGLEQFIYLFLTVLALILVLIVVKDVIAAKSISDYSCRYGVDLKYSQKNPSEMLAGKSYWSMMLSAIADDIISSTCMIDDSNYTIEGNDEEAYKKFTERALTCIYRYEAPLKDVWEYKKTELNRAIYNGDKPACAICSVINIKAKKGEILNMNDFSAWAENTKCDKVYCSGLTYAQFLRARGFIPLTFQLTKGKDGNIYYTTGSEGDFQQTRLPNNQFSYIFFYSENQKDISFIKYKFWGATTGAAVGVGSVIAVAIYIGAAPVSIPLTIAAVVVGGIGAYAGSGVGSGVAQVVEYAFLKDKKVAIIGMPLFDTQDLNTKLTQKYGDSSNQQNIQFCKILY